MASVFLQQCTSSPETQEKQGLDDGELPRFQLDVVDVLRSIEKDVFDAVSTAQAELLYGSLLTVEHANEKYGLQ